MDPKRVLNSLMPTSMPDPGVFKARVSGTENMGQFSATFDSELSTSAVNGSSNATLTISLRLFLAKINTNSGVHPTSAPGKPVELRDWDDPNGEFTRFRDGVKEHAERFWDNKFWLLPPPEYRGLDSPAASPCFHPNIACRFQIVLASGPLDAHAVIQCFCPKTEGDFRSNAGDRKGQWTCYDLENRQNDGLLDLPCKKDVGDPLAPGGMVQVDSTCRAWSRQEPVCHEVGHLLGLEHVGVYMKTAACVSGGNTDARSCYDGPTQNDTENIMGVGMKLAPWNVRPWSSRLVSHIGISLTGWRVSMSFSPPRPI